MTRRACLLLALAACAPARPTGDPPPQRAQTRIELPSGRVQVIERTVETRVDATLLPVPVDRAYSVLGTVLAAAGLRPTAADPARALVMVEGQRARGEIGGTPLGEWFECGTSVTGPATASHTLFATVRLHVVSDGGRGSVLRTHVHAVARDPASSSPAVPCVSRGVLERRLAREVRARLAPPP